MNSIRSKLLLLPALLVVACGAPLTENELRAPAEDEVGTAAAALRPGQVERVLSGSVAVGEWAHFDAIEVAPGSAFDVTMTGSGDPDLYVDFGFQPDAANWSCFPNKDGAVETCSLSVPAGMSKAFVSVRGYAASPAFTLRVAYVPSKPVVVQEESFTHYVVRGVSRIRDGGSIVIDGYVNRSTDAVVRLDGGLSSPTRGQFFVKVTRWPQPSQPERQMTANERAQLKVNLENYVARTPNADSALTDVIARL